MDDIEQLVQRRLLRSIEIDLEAIEDGVKKPHQKHALQRATFDSLRLALTLEP